MDEVYDLEDEEYLDIIKSTHVDGEYIEGKGDFEDVDVVFREIRKKYNLENLKGEDFLKIYNELKEKSNSSKTMVDNLLKIERNRLGGKIRWQITDLTVQ